MQLIFGILEAATILALNYPTTQLSQSVLSLFVFEGGHPERLYMSPTSAVGELLLLVGSTISLVAFRYLGKYFKFEASIQKDHKLITVGPYAYVRHPSYTGGTLVVVGWALWHYGEGSWF